MVRSRISTLFHEYVSTERKQIKGLFQDNSYGEEAYDLQELQ